MEVIICNASSLMKNLEKGECNNEKDVSISLTVNESNRSISE